MTLRALPVVKAFDRPDGYHWDAPSTALEKWAAVAPTAAADSDTTITIYDVIGEDFWSGGGFTAKRMSAALRSIGEKPVTVAINSPGGDMFEGLAIFNMLKDHKFEVTVKVMGLAASAASLIAMAGDAIQMGQGSFLMIHNAWGAVVGDQHAMRDAADMFAPFDAAMAEIYAARSGLDVAEVAQMMNAETFINAKEALAKGFADTSFEETKAPETGDANARAELSARRRLDALLARQGVARAERRKLFREAGMRNAAEPATPRAGFDLAAAERLISAFTP
ncbi:MAG: peptidase [Methylocystis sp.]|nr:MAG: peptidase [Methylocystis sp.]